MVNQAKLVPTAEQLSVQLALVSAIVFTARNANTRSAHGQGVLARAQPFDLKQKRISRAWSHLQRLLIIAASSVACFSNSVWATFPFSVDAGADAFTGWVEQNTSLNGIENGRFFAPSGTLMDTAGISWGLYANSGQMTSDTYVFNFSMSIGDSVSISVGLGFVSAGGAEGFGLQNSSHINLFETYYIGSDATDAWKINDAEGQESITGVDTLKSLTPIREASSHLLIMSKNWQAEISK